MSPVLFGLDLVAYVGTLRTHQMQNLIADIVAHLLPRPIYSNQSDYLLKVLWEILQKPDGQLIITILKLIRQIRKQELR